MHRRRHVHCWNMAKSTKLGRTARPWNTSACWNTPLMQGVSLKKKKFVLILPLGIPWYSMAIGISCRFQASPCPNFGTVVRLIQVEGSRSHTISGWSCGLLTRYQLRYHYHGDLSLPSSHRAKVWKPKKT